eukprot:g5775.t1
MADKESAAGTNVQVAVRCRPLNAREKASGNLHVVNTEPSNHRIRVAHKKLDRTYQYDHVFGPFASQEEVFTSTVEPIVKEMLQGFSTTVFAYGQTGTGKTHTMEGDITSHENMGVIPRSVHAIFDYLDGISADYTVRTSFLELYNEELADLLADSNSKSKVVLREDSKRGVVCCGLEEVQVLTAKDIFNILGKGIQQRKTAETLMNKNSSRSHSIFTLKIMIKECMPDGQEVMRNGQLNLVDLAGSECVGRSGAKNARAREAGNINQSLLTLGRVITALVEHHPHVPYRDSKLTRLLQESLGGRAKTCIIATVTSSSDALEETLSSLDYALKAKSIQNKPVANQKLSKTHLLKEYAGEVESLRSMLQASRDKNGVYVEPWRFDQMENTIASQGNQITEMEAVLHSRNGEAKELKAERDAFKVKGEELEQELEASKGREDALSVELGATQGRLERTEADLAASQALAAELQAKLTSTEQELQATRMELRATRAVVAEQASTERALLAEAAQTTASLGAAELDVDGLRAKVERQDQEAARKRSGAASFGGNATAAASDVSEAVARFSGEHRRGCGDLKGFLVKAEASARQASRGLSAAAAEALQEADRMCKEMATGVSTGAASTDELVAAAASALENALVEQKGAINTWSEEMAGSLDNLRGGLESHEGELAELCEDVRRRAEQATKEMLDFKDKCAGELAEVRSWADQRIAALTEQMERQSEEAKVVAARSKEETKVEVAQLMETLSGLMSGLQTNATARADRQASAAGEAWSRSISAARSLGPEVSQKMGGIAESVAHGSEVVVQKLALSSSATANSIKDCQSAAAGFASSTGGASGVFKAGADRAAGLADAASSSLKESIAAVSESVGKTADSCADSAEALSGANKDAAEGIATLAATSEQTAADLALEGGEQVEGLTAAVDGLESSHKSSLGQCVAQIEEHVEDACAVLEPSGGTPEKKAYPRPDKFSTTRPHKVIMSEARGGNLGALFSAYASQPDAELAATASSSTLDGDTEEGESEERGDPNLPTVERAALEDTEVASSTAGVEEEEMRDGEEIHAVVAPAVEPEDITLQVTPEGSADAAAADNTDKHGPASPGEENRSSKDSGTGAGGVHPAAAKEKVTTPTDFKAMKTDRASRIAARTSALSGGAGDRKRASVAGEEDAATSPPLGEATNTSKAVAGQQLASKAVALGDAKALRKYLEASVDGNSRVLTGVIDGKTSWRLRLLHLAAFEGSVDTVLLLLSAGASVNAQDLDGWTPLMYAARNETDGEALVPTLIAAGAELDKKNNRGRTALHIAYLARNFQVVSELLEHGASDMVRDEIGKTPSQMLGQGKLVRRRPWSGSSAILGGSKELSACRRGLKCPERPRTASGLVDGKKRLLGRSSFGTESESEKRSFQPQDTGIEVGDSISTLKKHPDGAIREVNDGSITTAEAGPGNGGRGRGGGTHGETSPRACWRCHREIVILEGRGHQGCHLTGGSSGLAAPSWDSGGTGLGQKSLHICGSDDDGGKGEGSGFAFDSTYTSRTISRGHRQHRPCPLSPGADTLLVENSAFGTLSTDEEERHPRHADGFAAVNTPSEGGDSAILAKTSSPRGEEATAVELSASQLRRHDEEQEERFDVNGRVAVESQEPRQSATCRANGPRGGGEGSGHKEVGRPEGREALSVGLVDAFEKERSLVLSIPAGSRTLREVGQQIHKANGRRYKKKESTADGAIFDQVESLAVQACRAVCWFHRCGLVHGDLTPDNFVVLGGTAGLSSTSSSPITGRRFAHTAGACAGRGGFGGGGKVGGAARWEGKLRLMVGRSVSRRSDEAGGCPRHPLLEPVNRNFPTNEPFDKAYATPERVQASLYDAPWPAEVAEDAWAFGVIVRWLLTGRDECVPGSDVENPSGCVASAKVLDSLACPGNVCSILPGLLAADPRSRESALALAARHVSTKSRSPRTPPTSLRSSRRKRSPEGSPGAPSGRLSPRPSSTRAATNSLPAATAGGAEPAPHRGQGLQEKEENAEPPPNLEAAAAANALKERVVDRPPPVKTTASSQARGGRSADISGSRGVATGAGVGTSPRASGAHSGQVTSSSPVMSTLRATFKMGPSSSRRSKIMGSLPLVSAGAMQRATNRAARSALSGTKGRDRGGSGSSSDSSASSSSASAVVAAAAAGGEVLEDQGAPKAAGAGAEPASGGLERTLLVEFRSAELDGQSGDEEEDDRGGQPTANDFEATAAVDFSAEGGRGKVVGGREEILPTGGAEELEGEKIVPAGNGGNPLRNKKRSRVTPLGSGEPNNRRPVKGEVGSMAGRGSATTGGVNTGDGQNLRGGSSASGGVVGKKRLSDAGVQCARPAEGSELMGGGLGRGRCRCVVM